MHPRSYLLVLLLFIGISFSPLVLATESQDLDLGATGVEQDLQGEDSTSPRRRHDPGSLFRHLRRTSSETCPTNYFQCGKGLPIDFCCPTGDLCNALADNTTVLCCPDGQDCSSIEPITCSLSDLNATAFPATSVHTTNLTGELPTCGEGCCPFGYTCNQDSTCDRTQSTTLEMATSSISPASTMTVTTATGTAAGLVMATATTQASPTSTSISSSSSSTESSEEKNRTIGIAVGSAAGGLVCIGGLIVFALVMRRRAARTLSASESTRELGNQSRSTRATVPYQSSKSTGTLPLYQGRSTGTLPSRGISAPEPSPPPPPLPPKEYYAPPKKRTSLLSWVPSVINRTPVELPATPVSQWGQIQRPEQVYGPYSGEQRGNIHELEADARWLPREGSL